MEKLRFITKQNLMHHVQETIRHYGEALTPFDLKKFNGNIIDPIKLAFDKSVYGYTWEELIQNEIFRQRDKANNNAIGYFHQYIFKYMEGCTVPQAGWDVILDGEKTLPECGTVHRIYVEMKNKHNTMNSASSAKTYMKMQGQLLHDDDCACLLVEAIAKKSQNITWEVTLDKAKQKHRRIRRVSMDVFYELVTGETDAFYQLCMALPDCIEQVLAHSAEISLPEDSVLDELRTLAKASDGTLLLALYMLGFSSYLGFKSK
ncbi:Eco47II family restriction endonuclease [uncultured Selenomonas sp.]|uniref:Eco47II family restriction endonuclease n=1 Tax=uncultured Selenomonas sp. TaxID=159275 RepID=UPI0028DCBD76|nr:Eco47II family restriction endonuclease [uncultured Selenomonas sp.]